MANPVEKTLWYIESHLQSELSLEDLARAARVSPHHLVRAFGVLTGYPVMRYVRLRRLTRAADRLLTTDTGILEIALEAGYGSHEAFTRAFSAQFGVAPATAQKTRALDNLKRMEPLKMNENPYPSIRDPRIVAFGPILIAGLKKRYNNETSAAIPSQWQEFTPFIGHVPNQKGNAAYGVLHNNDGEGNVDYLCGVEVSDFAEIPAGFETLRLAPRTYAVFEHAGHVSEIRRTWHAIFKGWLPANDREIADAPDFERYSEKFDPRSGTGGIEIWIPLMG